MTSHRIELEGESHGLLAIARRKIPVQRVPECRAEARAAGGDAPRGGNRRPGPDRRVAPDATRIPPQHQRVTALRPTVWRHYSAAQTVETTPACGVRVIRYLIDTNIISEMHKPKPHGAVVAWFKGLRDEQICLSAVTLGELQEGIERTRKQDAVKAMAIEA